jgi:hypothetical protein
MTLRRTSAPSVAAAFRGQSLVIVRAEGHAIVHGTGPVTSAATTAAST